MFINYDIQENICKEIIKSNIVDLRKYYIKFLEMENIVIKLVRFLVQVVLVCIK